MADLELVPITRDEAIAFIVRYHRTHKKRLPGWRFGVGLARDGAIVGVAACSNPKARMLNDGWTLEVSRVCVLELPRVRAADGREHAAGAVAMLYAACWRAARALGFRRLVTYTLPSEGGGEPPRRWLEAHRRGRRRLVVAARASSCRRAPDAGEAAMGACRVTRLVRQVRDPDYRAAGERRRARQIELELGVG